MPLCWIVPWRRLPTNLSTNQPIKQSTYQPTYLPWRLVGLGAERATGFRDSRVDELTGRHVHENKTDARLKIQTIACAR